MPDNIHLPAGGSPLPRGAYRVKEAARITSLSEKSIRRAIDRGLITPNRAFRVLLIPVSELERFIQG